MHKHKPKQINEYHILEAKIGNESESMKNTHIKKQEK